MPPLASLWYLETAFSRNWNLNEEVPGMSYFVIDVPSDFQPKNALTLFEYIYAQEIQEFKKEIDENSDFEELREIVDLQWLADFLGCGQIAKWAENLIEDNFNYYHVIDLWKRNPNKFHEKLAVTMQSDSKEPEYQQDFLKGIRKNVSKIENSDELDRFLELMNSDESCDENAESSETKNSEALIPEPMSKRLRKNNKKPIEKPVVVKTKIAPSCKAPYFKLQIQLAWFLQRENKKSDFAYLKKCIFSTDFEHKDFYAESKCEFFQSIVEYLGDSLIKEATAHIFKKTDSVEKQNYSEKLTSFFAVVKPSDEELAEMTKLSLECGDSRTRKTIEAIKKKRESKSYDMFDLDFYHDRSDRVDSDGEPEEIDRTYYEYDPDGNDLVKNSKMCWTDFIDETVGKVSWKVRIYTLGNSDFFSIGVQIITEENMIKRNQNQSHKAKFYCWKSKSVDDDYYHRRTFSHRQSKNQKIEKLPDAQCEKNVQNPPAPGTSLLYILKKHDFKKECGVNVSSH